MWVVELPSAMMKAAVAAVSIPLRSITLMPWPLRFWIPSMMSCRISVCLFINNFSLIIAKVMNKF